MNKKRKEEREGEKSWMNKTPERGKTARDDNQLEKNMEKDEGRERERRERKLWKVCARNWRDESMTAGKKKKEKIRPTNTGHDEEEEKEDQMHGRWRQEMTS